MKMKFPSLKKSLVCTSIVVSSLGVGYACGGGDWDWPLSSHFTPEIFVPKSFENFNYSSSSYFYNTHSVMGEMHNYNDDNVAEWRTYLNNKYTTEKLKNLMYAQDSGASFEAVYEKMKKGNKGIVDGLDLNDTKTRNFVIYMYTTQMLEQFSNQEVDYWDYKPQKRSKVDLPQSIKKNFDSVSNDAFLKNRYWFLTLRSYFYSDDPQKVISFFDETQAAQPKNSLYYRGWNYVGGVYKKNKNYAKANYVFAQVFDNAEGMRSLSNNDFKPQSETDFNQSLQLAKTPKEKIALWSVLGYYKDEFRSMQEIYALDPKSEHLDYLLVRSVNIYESGNTAFAEKEKGSGANAQYKKRIAGDLDKKKLEFIQKVAQSKNTHNPQLWLTAAGYLSTMKGNYSEATKFLGEAAKMGNSNADFKNQLRLLNYLNTLLQVEKMNEKSIQSIMGDFKWLVADLNTKYTYEDSFRFQQAVEFSKHYISNVYSADKNMLMAELFVPNSPFLDANENLEQLKKLMNNPGKSNWESLALSQYPHKLGDILRFQVVQLVYNDQLDAAVALSKQIPADQDVILLGNPFNGKIKDCNDCDHNAKQSVKYNVQSLLAKMKDMKTNIDQGVDVYNNAMLLGNAYYNMSYYGNARYFYQTTIYNSRYDLNSKSNNAEFNTNLATKYYTLALKQATDDEQRAKMQYMLAKTQRNNFYYDTYFKSGTYYGYPEPIFKAWDGFKELKSKYANTKYYKEVINECGYFRTYLKK